MHRSMVLSAAIAALSLPLAAKATLIAGDSYLLNPPNAASAGGYTAASGLASQYATVSVPGFLNTGGGTGTAQFQAQSGGLVSSSDLADATSSGKVGYINPGSSTTVRSTGHNMATVPTSSVYYESYLVNMGTFSGTAAASGQAILVGFGNATDPTSPGTTAAPTGLTVGFAQQGATATNGSLVIRYDSNSSNVMADTTVIDGSTTGFSSFAGVTDLIVAEIDVNGSGVSGSTDLVKWWLNPTDGTSDTTLTATSAVNGTFNGDIVNDSNAGSSFTRLNYFSNGFGNSTNASAYFDEPRLSSDLSGLGLATPSVPEPASLTLVGIGMVGLLRRRRTV